MSNNRVDMFHKAARDGYLDILREATRRDCNKGDEDGMTPTLWATFYGNLDALRMIVGRGGNPDMCDYFGSTALHHAAANGHMNCVTFLVSFGTNLWSLDNELRTPLDMAGLTGRREIVRYLDSVYAKQTQLNKKMVKKWKEKAILDAQKRIKKTSKLRKKSAKEALKEDQKLSKMFNKLSTGHNIPHQSAPSSLHATVRSHSTVSSNKTHYSEPKPYSAHFTITAQNKKLFIGAVAKKIRQKSREPTLIEKEGEFKVRQFDSDGTRSVRSLSGLKRDPHVMYVRGRVDGSVSSTDSGHSRDDLFRVYPKAPDAVSRALSEPEFFYNGDSGIDMPDSPEPGDRASIFERPGFGSVAFMNHRVLSSLPQEPDDATISKQTDGTKQKGIGAQSKRKRILDEGSIGTVGSLAARMKDLPWGDDIVDDLPSHSDLELFLASQGLSEYFMLFRQEDIDLQGMLLLTEKDFKDLGLPMGPRRKLVQAVKRRKDTLDQSNGIIDTRL